MITQLVQSQILAGQASLRALNALTCSVIPRSVGKPFDTGSTEEANASGQPWQSFTHNVGFIEGATVTDYRHVLADTVARFGDCQHTFYRLIESECVHGANGPRCGQAYIGPPAYQRPLLPS